MGISNFSGNNNGNPPSGGNNGGSMPGIGSMLGAGTIDPLEFVINYNDKFKNGGKAMFRDELVHQTLAVLISKNKPNALLVGPAGVGKTKIVEHIAWSLANDDPIIPDRLKGATVYELPLSNIVAGSSYVGQLEEKIKAVIEFMTDPTNKAILFIDEIHQLVGDSQTYEKIAQILKPALARGEMRVIGATTVQEATNLADDPAFNRRFSRLIVDELTQQQTIEILQFAKMGFVMHYQNKVVIDDSLMPTVVNIADQYSTAGSHRPDNALTLLDRAIGDAVVKRKVMEVNAQNDPAVLAAIKSMPLIPVTERQLKQTAMKLMTGHSKKETLDMQSLTDHLSVIRGQDDIIAKLITLLKRDDRKLFPRTKPLTMLFAGTSGVGKTEVTKIIALEMTGVKPITLNMGEYHSSASINRIIGAPAGYVGYDSHGELPFDALESNPYQIILLDEFEKCDKSVQRLFMSAFDEGYIKTNKGKIIDFSKSIIIATTNAAHKGDSKSLGFISQSGNESLRTQVNDLSKWFDVELLNRFQNRIFTFHELSEDIYRDIIVDKYHKEVARIRDENRRITLPDDIPDDELTELVRQTYVPAFGARPAASAVQEYIEEHAI